MGGRGRAWGWVRAIGAVLVAAYLSYVLASVVAFNSPVVRDLINSHPYETKIGWGFAWSPWPRRLEVHGLRIRSRNLNVQWELTVDRAGGEVEVSELVHRTFAARGVRARGVSLRFRPTVPDSPHAREQVLAFPPISDVEDPPIRALGPLRPPRPEAWTVKLDDARFEQIRELWIAAYRIQTHGTAEGRLHTRAGWWVDFDARAQVPDGEVTVRGEPVARGVQLELTGRMRLPDIPHSKNADRVRALAGTVSVRGELVSAAFVAQHLPDLPIPPVRTRAQLSGAAGLSGGALTAGSQLRVDGGELVADLEDGWRLQAERWRLQAEVAERGGEVATRVSLELNPLVLSDEQGVLVSTPEVLLRAQAAGAQVLGVPDDYRLAAYVARTQPADVRRFSSRWLQGTGIQLDGGTVSFFAGAKAREDRVPEGDLHLEVAGVRARLDDLAVSGGGKVHLNLERLQLRREVAILSGSRAVLEGVTLHSPRGSAEGWHAELVLTEAALRTRGTPSFDARFEGKATDARPFLLVAGDKLPSWSLRLLEADGLEVRGTLHAAPGRLSLTRFEADGRGLSLRGGLGRDARGTRGALLARIRRIPVGIAILGGDTSVHVGRNEWLEGQLRSLDLQ